MKKQLGGVINTAEFSTNAELKTYKTNISKAKSLKCIAESINDSNYLITNSKCPGHSGFNDTMKFLKEVDVEFQRYSKTSEPTGIINEEVSKYKRLTSKGAANYIPDEASLRTQVHRVLDSYNNKANYPNINLPCAQQGINLEGSYAEVRK